MSEIFVASIALVAAAGILVAAFAAAMPSSNVSRDNLPRWDSVAATHSETLRDRNNRPFRAFAERSGREGRLNGGLSLDEHLARADLKLRSSEFVMIQVGCMLVASLLSLWRFGFAPQFVIAGVIAYLIPMRYVKWRQGR